ncbi:MAG: hypothetical protein FJ034_01775 [Chloroflexi bacterium]|nr:hypothetical protein [Chloroflexota bacterium]
MPVLAGSPILSSKINQTAHRWLVIADSPANVGFSNPGTHPITWMMVYFDNARPNTHGYLTQETIEVAFSGVGAGIVQHPAFLDMTSTNADRHHRYLKYQREMRGAMARAAKTAIESTP